MNEPTLSIILPTMGRPTLARTLESIDRQLGPQDEVLLIADADSPNLGLVKKFTDRLDERYRMFPHSPGQPVGQPLRNRGLELAARDYIVWMGDDDVFTPDALQSIRTALTENPGRCHMFRWHAWQCGLAWREKKIEEGNVGDHPFVCPNDKEKLGKFGMRYAGDFDFIRETVDNFGGDDTVVWREEVIAITRPERFQK